MGKRRGLDMMVGFRVVLDIRVVLDLSLGGMPLPRGLGEE